MAENAPHQYGRKYPLLVYRSIARRYRPLGYLAFIVGLLAQLPVLIVELRPQNFFIDYPTLSFVGIISMVIGVALVVASIFEERRAFVRCGPEFLTINTASSRVVVSYARFTNVKSARVADIYPWREYKGRQRRIIKPFGGENAVELVLRELPLPERELRRRLSRFVISRRDVGFVFIVPAPGDLMIELNTYKDRAREAEAEAKRQRYVEPMMRGGRG